MKKILLIIPFLFACGPSKEEMEKQMDINRKLSYKDTPGGISVITIDACEYVYCERSSGIAIIHKANCKNHNQ